MKLKNLTKSLSVIFMLLAMLFSCDQLTDEITNNSGNNTTQDGGNNNSGNNSGNENGSENNGENSNTEKPAEKITITFDVNEIDETVPAAIETTASKSVELPTLTNAKFSHWNTKADGSGLSYKDSATFTESVTLYAILLAVNAHKITYVLDGGVNNPQNSFSFTEDDYIGLKNPSKDGYKFLGWYDNKNFTGNAIKGWAVGDKTADVTLYAKWEKEPEPAVKVTITFNTNGAGGTVPAAIETTASKSVELPTLTNAKFSHWNTKADGSGLSYKDSAIFVESVTLYAILLAENAHKITYELNGGVNNSQNKYSFTEDDMVALREPTKDGYKVLGWYETADFSGEAIKVWFEGEKTADVTLYAKWIVGYTITYELNGGINHSSNPSFFTEDDYSIDVYAPTREGYKFIGWYETADFTGSCISYFYTSTNLRNITLYAKWEQIIPGIYLAGLYDLNGSGHWATSSDFGDADAMTKGENDVWTFTFTAEITKPFPYGFKFATENGWQEQYQAYNKNNPTDDFTILQPGEEAGVYFATKAEVEAKDEDGNRIPDYATKFNLGANQFIVGNEYTITFDKANMKVKITGEFNYVQINYITVTIVINENASLILKNVPTFDIDDMATIDGSLFSWCGGSEQTLKSTDCEVTANWAGAEEYTWVAEQQPTDVVEGADAWAKLAFSVTDKEYWIPYSTITYFEYDLLTGIGSEILPTSINITSTPSKTSYYVGEELDLSGLEIEAVYSNGSTSYVDVSLDMVSGFNSSVAGTQTLTITYGDCTATFDVEVVENSVSSLNITSTPYKTSYYVGEELDLSKLEIEATYSDGSTSYVDVSLDMVSGFDTSVAGTQTLTITYGDCTTTFDVEVIEE